MNMNFTKPIKAPTRLRPTSGGWIPPTETGHSLADQSGITLVEAATALLMMLIVALGSSSLFSGALVLSAAEK
jgi:hypothetical protein